MVMIRTSAGPQQRGLRIDLQDGGVQERLRDDNLVALPEMAGKGGSSGILAPVHHALVGIQPGMVL